MKERDEHILAEAICGLGGMIGQLVRELSQINNNQAILCRLAEMERVILLAITTESRLSNEDQQLLDALSARTKRQTLKLERLSAMTPRVLPP